MWSEFSWFNEGHSRRSSGGRTVSLGVCHHRYMRRPPGKTIRRAAFFV
jgi:hypothetical protein